MQQHEHDIEKTKLAKKIAGEIVLAQEPGAAIQKWRTIFKIPQRELAQKMSLMPSVISDYESGRRKSPGVAMIKKIVNSLLKIDKTNGNTITKQFNSLYSNETLSDAILDICETTKPYTLKDITTYVNGKLINEENEPQKPLYGYTIIDSLKAIIELSPKELAKLYSMTTERALIFTKVERGRSPLIAIKVTNLKPSAVIFHGPKEIDRLAQRIAKVEKIPLIISQLETVDQLIANLKTNIKPV
ncbi:MAG: transcriptional regulator [Candidatus Nanohalarchaeota archaeon]|nr:MAG: transcriptional regulator [Candidatus Nanohaloarchaeota archaeon]